MFKVVAVIFLCILYASQSHGYLDESVLTDELKELIASLHKTCFEKHKVDTDVIVNTHEGVFPEDDKLKCYMNCILSEGGAMDEDGKLDFASINELVPTKLKGPIKAMFDKCETKGKNSELCERSFEFYKCCYEMDPKNYFLF